MARDYATAGNRAVTKMQRDGRVVQMVKINPQPFDPNKPWRGSEMLVDTKLNYHAVFVDPVSEKDLGRQLVRGDEENTDNITRGMVTAFMAAFENLDANGNPVDLSSFDRMIDNNLVYTVKEMQILSPGPVPVLYLVYLER